MQITPINSNYSYRNQRVQKNTNQPSFGTMSLNLQKYIRESLGELSLGKRNKDFVQIVLHPFEADLLNNGRVIIKGRDGKGTHFVPTNAADSWTIIDAINAGLRKYDDLYRKVANAPGEIANLKRKLAGLESEIKNVQKEITAERNYTNLQPLHVRKNSLEDEKWEVLRELELIRQAKESLTKFFIDA